jgi:formylglycine-generating enzyme required for sulfatase activity
MGGLNLRTVGRHVLLKSSKNVAVSTRLAFIREGELKLRVVVMGQARITWAREGWRTPPLTAVVPIIVVGAATLVGCAEYACDEYDMTPTTSTARARRSQTAISLPKPARPSEAGRQRLVMQQPPSEETRTKGEIAKTPAPDATRSAQDFRDCANCPAMVVVPAGTFMMGSNAGGADEKPVHKVTIARPFAVGKFDVTFAEWDACVAADACKHKPDDLGWGRGARPVINVSWDDANREYLPWLNGKTGKIYRLLSEAEWEYAARAGATTTYSWGNDVGKGNANCAGCGNRWDGKQTAPVGSFKPNAFGLYDMNGNVWQWVADCYKDSYLTALPDGATAPEAGGCSRVLRGGSWLNNPHFLRAANRAGFTADYRYSHIGLRLARSLDP